MCMHVDMQLHMLIDMQSHRARYTYNSGSGFPSRSAMYTVAGGRESTSETQ